jgi:uncharacterized protein YndB with AHSA1/START domain
MSKNEIVLHEDDQEITVSRLFAAPRERVWAAWTKPAQVAQWWGPDGFTTTVHTMDVHPGGSWEFVMHAPNGMDFPNSITYELVDEPNKLVLLHKESTEFGLKAWRAEVTFETIDDNTRVTMRNRFADPAEKAKHVTNFGAIEGAEQTLARLGDHVTANS